MQNKPYTIQFFLPPDDRFTISPQAVITDPQICKLCEIKKKKFELSDKSGFELTIKRRADSRLPSNPHS